MGDASLCRDNRVIEVSMKTQEPWWRVAAAVGCPLSNGAFRSPVNSPDCVALPVNAGFVCSCQRQCLQVSTNVASPKLTRRQEAGGRSGRRSCVASDGTACTEALAKETRRNSSDDWPPPPPPPPTCCCEDKHKQMDHMRPCLLRRDKDVLAANRSTPV
jgi:hypothetical protein